MPILTSRTQLTAVALNDWVHIVDVSDTTDNAAGSSKKVLVSDLLLQASLISSGSGAPATTPSKIGNIYINTAGPAFYYAKGTTNSGDWVLLTGGGGGGTAAGQLAVNQVGHGFAVKDIVTFQGGVYAKARANTLANSQAVGMVTAVTDANNFTVTQAGYITGLSGLTANTLYLLDPNTAGAMTATEPSAGSYRRPVFLATSTTAGWILDQKSDLVTTATQANDVLLILPSVDKTISGPQTSAIPAGQAITVQVQSVFLDGTGRWSLTDASVASTSGGILGITVQTAILGATLRVGLAGCIIRDNTFTFTPGQDIYLSETTGAWTATAPTTSGSVIRKVGKCIGAGYVLFDPDDAWVVNP